MEVGIRIGLLILFFFFVQQAISENPHDDQSLEAMDAIVAEAQSLEDFNDRDWTRFETGQDLKNLQDSNNLNDSAE